MNNQTDELFADLFAFRFSLLDYYNEIEIIKRLKLELIDRGYNLENLNNIIFNFYDYYLIPITEEEIENININMTLLMQNRNLINLIFNYLNSSNLQEIEEESEELQQLSLEEFNKLPIQKITDQEDIECAICIDKFEKENEIIKLNCNHIYHKDCIKNYLLNYNNKCTMCRYKI